MRRDADGSGSLFRGPQPYRPATRWPPLAAAAAAFAITVASMLVSSLAVSVDQSEARNGMLAPLLVMQVVTVLLTLVISGWLGDRRVDVLALRAPAAGWGVLLPALLLIAALAALSSLVTMLASPESLRQDIAPLRALLSREPLWLVFAMVSVGAPLAEELLFRGFLFAALARSAIGIPGAVIVTTAIWTLMHAGYSLFGLAEVALAGLLFSWLLLRTGSLWVPIICHAAHNAAVVVALPWLPA
jgi:hypothetical protein